MCSALLSHNTRALWEAVAVELGVGDSSTLRHSDLTRQPPRKGHCHPQATVLYGETHLSPAGLGISGWSCSQERGSLTLDRWTFTAQGH